MTTMTEASPLRGVALIVRNPNNEIVLVEELQTKERYGKYAGMFSPPMETCHDEESDESALIRLVDEELPGLAEYIVINPERRGMYQVVPDVWVSLYTGQIQNLLLPTLDATSIEIGRHVAEPPTQALTRWLRQGAREMLLDYIADRRKVIRWECASAALSAPRITL